MEGGASDHLVSDIYIYLQALDKSCFEGWAVRFAFLSFSLFCFSDLVVEGLRCVVLSRDLCHKFLLLAESNTVRGIETCGILCGKLVWSSFHVSAQETFQSTDVLVISRAEYSILWVANINFLEINFIKLLSLFMNYPSRIWMVKFQVFRFSKPSNFRRQIFVVLASFTYISIINSACFYPREVSSGHRFFRYACGTTRVLWFPLR